MTIPGQRSPSYPGETTVQLTRSIRPHDAGPQDGEDSIFQAYQAAFQAAKRSIYIENQHPGEETLLRLLEEALQRGVEVTMVVPAHPMRAIYEERHASHHYNPDAGAAPPRYHGTFQALSRLQRYPGFKLMGLATSSPEAPKRRGALYSEIYVHAKLCIVDGAWVTCGSANFVDLSFHRDHTELNASWWDPAGARQMLRDLIAEHTHETLPAEASDERTWLKLLGQVAADNATRRQQQRPMRGHAYLLDATVYPFAPGP